MRIIPVQTIDDIAYENVYNITDFPYHNFYHYPTVKKQFVEYYNMACAFDIETTNIRQGKYAYMYHWQFCMDDTVVFGRRWEEFMLFVKKLKEHLYLGPHRRMVVYIHNLSFEFQFLRYFWALSDVFITRKRQLLKFCIDGIEFRCSYKLSNMSLAKFCENTANVRFYKLVDTFDYNKIRTADTPLTDTEAAYCYCDVRGLCECINELLKEDTIVTIPLTSTGYVRRLYRKSMQANPKNRDKFLNMKLDADQYKLLRKTFRGGDTHANRDYVRDLLYDVHSMDIESSYPAAMAMEKFPMSKFTPVRKDIERVLKMPENCWFACLLLINPRYNGKSGNPYIPLAKCTSIKNYINDNGRILRADALEIPITDIDYKIILNEYKYDRLYIKDMYTARYGYMPKEFTAVLLHLYQQKTALKGIEEKYYEYMKSKNRINASYGMEVTDIAKDDIEYLEGNFHKVETDLQEKLDKYYKSRNSFLSYQHGVWTTAHARYKLRHMLWQVTDDNVYDDTDSIKFLDEKNILLFEKENEKLKQKAIEHNCTAIDKDGNMHYMGIWTYEGMYTKFKTLGAKKYLFEKKNKKGKLEIASTISGVNVEKGAEFFRENGFDAFHLGTPIDPSGHLSATYNDVPPHYITVNGCKMLTSSNVYMEETPYIIGITNDYAELLGISEEMMKYFKSMRREYPLYKIRIIDNEIDNEEGDMLY